MPTESSTSLTLSLCMIVKNEESSLSRCLASTQEYVDEIIIVDTGSQDSTVSIAEEFGAKVSYFEWCNDFAAARNHAISLAQGQWILMLDADEELIVTDTAFRNQLTNIDAPSVYCLDLTDAYKGSTVSVLWASRLFQNSPDLKYMGRYHEQLTYQAKPIDTSISDHFKGLKILHYGYGQEELAQKHHHRIALLEDILEAEGVNLAWMRTLAANYHAKKQLDQVERCQAQVFDYLLPYLISGEPPVPFLSGAYWIYSLGMRCLQQEDIETAQMLCQRGLEWAPMYPPISYFAGLLSQSLGLHIGAVAYFNHCMQLDKRGSYDKGEPFDKTITTSFSSQGLGISYTKLKQWQQAKESFELALEFDPTSSLALNSLADINQRLSV